MSASDLEEMGPIDYVVLEWPGRVKEQGVLTDAEFAAQKAKILG